MSDGAHLLDELHRAVTKYVVLPTPEAVDAVVLWIAASHAQPAWEHAPRLAAVSPEKRCGKSRLMDVVEATCHRPLITVNASVAAVFRSIGDDPRTLLVDEADTIFGSKRQAENNEDLRGLLNAGHQRNRPALRVVGIGTAQHVGEFKTFAMAMLASIGELPDTIMDRAIVVRMRRRAPHEKVDPFRTARDAPPLHDLRDRLAAWVREHLDELRDTDPVMPVEDRAADTWAPLVAIADLAGADWPTRARQAVLVGVQEAEEGDGEASLRLRLLADLKTVFGKDSQALHTKTILHKLHHLEGAPWKDLFGKPLDSYGLSHRLKPYGIKPTDVRETGTGPNLKGYKREDLHDAWTRYQSATCATEATLQVSLSRIGTMSRINPRQTIKPRQELAATSRLSRVLCGAQPAGQRRNSTRPRSTAGAASPRDIWSARHHGGPSGDYQHREVSRPQTHGNHSAAALISSRVRLHAGRSSGGAGRYPFGGGGRPLAAR